VGGALFTSAGREITIKAQKTRTTTVGGLLSVSAATSAVLSGVTELDAKALMAELKGSSQLVLKVGDHKVSLSGTEIRIETTGSIRVSAETEATLIGPQANLNDE
jgi:hypothetical protein